MRALPVTAGLLVAMLISPTISAASNTDPPADVVPTTMTLAGVLALHKTAIGSPKESPRTETWLYSQGDLNGTQTILSSGDDYREDMVLGPFHTASGSYRGQRWRQDANGITMLISGLHQRDDIDQQALEQGKQGGGVSLLGETWAPMLAYVVKVDPPGGRVEYIFYDETSHLIVRTERAVENRRVINTYDDFRMTDGTLRAWHAHESDGLPFNERDWKLQAIDTSTPINANVFAPPASDTTHVTLNGSKIVLPGKIIADRVILIAQIGAHKVAFQLDSGASQILLDKSVADALRLPTFEKETEITAGTYTATQSIVPRIEFGGVTLKNMAIMTAPFQQWDDGATPVAGLLGFDFLATCVVHIDYLNGEADALDPKLFQPPPGAFALPILLDDAVPVVPVKIATVTSQNFIVDTGADRSILFSSFVARHPDAVADQGLGEEFAEAFPFLNDIVGVGGKINVTHTQVSSITVGSAKFQHWLFSVVHDAPAFEGEDYDGLIGQDVLRNFDVYLDYPHLMIYFLPNERYRERWG